MTFTWIDLLKSLLPQQQVVSRDSFNIITSSQKYSSDLYQSVYLCLITHMSLQSCTFPECIKTIGNYQLRRQVQFNLIIHTNRNMTFHTLNFSRISFNTPSMVKVRPPQQRVKETIWKIPQIIHFGLDRCQSVSMQTF